MPIYKSATVPRSGQMTGRSLPSTGFMASTFGTLLSSQGTDAHRFRIYQPWSGATP